MLTLHWKTSTHIHINTVQLGIWINSKENQIFLGDKIKFKTLEKNLDFIANIL